MSTNQSEEVALEQFEKLKLELRRGSIVLAVLLNLAQEHYGYSLRKQLSEQGLEVEESTLYPLIRRLEKQQLLESEWREEDKRKKRFYKLSTIGVQVVNLLIAEWQSIGNSINQMIEEYHHGNR
jgi:PadR family transcriptional regulator, regulatory protein PadR